MIVTTPIITSPFGNRILQGKQQFHDGIDFIDKNNDRQVYSLGPGKTIIAFKDYKAADRWNLGGPSSGGNYVITLEEILGNKYYVKYLHLIENYVEKDVDISENYLLGIYDDCGYSFGAHVHASIYNLNWRIIDPTPLIKTEV
jgi:murein DD-endopeptidase MepM/ murein hydrolase activator NlpD